jgi:hypothetical protein
LKETVKTGNYRVFINLNDLGTLKWRMLTDILNNRKVMKKSTKLARILDAVILLRSWM